MASLADLASKYKTLFVIHSCTLRDFMNDHRLELAPGNGFYQLNRPGTVDSFRDILARRRSDGSFLTKSKFRSHLGIPDSNSVNPLKLDDGHLADFDIFVQSTSYGQLLNAGTEFLYLDEPFEAANDCSIDDADENGNGTRISPSNHSSPVKVPTRPVGPAGEAGSPVEIVFCFDTTGSMGGCIMEVRKHAQDLFQRLFADFPGIRICPFAHGDYIDRFKYVTTFIDFTRDKDAICEWVNTVDTTYGGDWEECYELALHEVRTQLSWSPGTRRALVMIGDAIPHEPHLSEAKLDWEAELEAMVNDLGVRIYAVQCGTNSLATKFWQTLALKSHGKHLHLESFSHVIDLILAICSREYSLQKLKDYESEVRARETARGSLEQSLMEIFAALQSEDTLPKYTALDQASESARVTPDLSHVKRDLASMDLASKDAVCPSEPKASGKKHKLAAALGESGSPAKRGRPASAKKDGDKEEEKKAKRGRPAAKKGGNKADRRIVISERLSSEERRLKDGEKKARRGRPPAKQEGDKSDKRKVNSKRLSSEECRPKDGEKKAKRGRPPLETKGAKRGRTLPTQKAKDGAEKKSVKRGRPPSTRGRDESEGGTAKRRRPALAEKISNKGSDVKVKSVKRKGAVQAQKKGGLKKMNMAKKKTSVKAAKKIVAKAGASRKPVVAKSSVKKVTSRARSITSKKQQAAAPTAKKVRAQTVKTKSAPAQNVARKLKEKAKVTPKKATAKKTTIPAKKSVIVKKTQAVTSKRQTGDVGRGSKRKAAAGACKAWEMLKKSPVEKPKQKAAVKSKTPSRSIKGKQAPRADVKKNKLTASGRPKPTVKTKTASTIKLKEVTKKTKVKPSAKAAVKGKMIVRKSIVKNAKKK